MDGLPKWVKPGAKFAHSRNTWEVRGVVDDRAVCRVWYNGIRHKEWRYALFGPKEFSLMTSIRPLTDD